MSRVGKMPVAVPKGVDVQITADQITVKGANGALNRALHALVSVKSEEGVLRVAPLDDSALADAMSGTTRALLANMVEGVSKGFEKKLSLVGVGFRAQAQGTKLNLQVGFSHPVVKDMPEGIKVECPTQTEIVITPSTMLANSARVVPLMASASAESSSGATRNTPSSLLTLTRA